MKTNFLLLLLGIATMAFVGCVKDPQVDPPKPDPVPIVNLKLSEVNVMASAIKFKVESSVATQPYLCLCVSKAFAEGKAEKVLIGELMADLKKQADAKSMDLRAFIASVANVGNKEIMISNLVPATEYTVIAFGVNGITPGADLSALSFATLRADKIDCIFTVEVTVSGNNVKYNIQPSNKETDWYFCTMPKEQFDNMTAENKWDESQMLIEYFAYQVAQLQSSGVPDDQVLAKLLHKGDLVLEAKGLDAEKEYVCLAGAIARTATGLVLVSDVKKDVYTTGKAPLSDMTFKITVDNISKTRADVKIEPTILTDKYLMLISNYSPDSKDLTPTEMMTSYYSGLGFFINMMTTSGAKDFPARKVAAGLDYFVLAFGYAGGPTTEPEIVKFSTPAGPNPADATIGITVDKTNPFGAALTFTPSDETIYYAFGLVKTGTIEKDSIIKYFEAGLIANLKQQHSMFGMMNMTMVDVIMSGYFNEVTPFNFSEMEPNTVYDAFTFTITMEGKAVAFKEHPAILKTPSVSATTASAEVLGIFDGDVEAGTIFGNANATAGQAIVAIKYTPSSADVTNIFTSVVKDNPSFDELDPNVISDKDLRSNLSWADLEVKSPYQFVLAEWNAAHYVFAYTGTADGSFGGIVRKLVPAPDKAGVGTNAQLKAIYDEAAATSKAKAKTVKSMSEIAIPVKRAMPMVCKKDVSSILSQYVFESNADKAKVVVPYSLGASIDLPISRIAK